MQRTRWWILTLLFFATTINYLDRIVFSVLIPVIREDLNLNDQDYGYINAAFQVCYTIGFIFMGGLIDKWGTKKGYTFSVIWWSLAAIGHALSKGAFGLSMWRGLLGLGESGNFPAAIKSVSEWFPKKDQALAIGLFNSGATISSIIGPPLFAYLVVQMGWRFCFIVTGGLGFVWLIFWLMTPKPPVSQEDEKEPQISWGEALRHRSTWGFAVAKFFSDPVWWFYLYWLPPYFFDVRKMDLKEIGWAIPVIYLIAGLGGVVGGWLSGLMIRRGMEPLRARKVGMAIFALCMPVAACSVLTPSPIWAIALISLATAAHQGWSSNLYAVTSDSFPKNAVASVTGIGGCAGGIGGVLFSALIPGYVVTNFGYTPVFLAMGVFHLVGLVISHFLLKEDRTPATA